MKGVYHVEDNRHPLHACLNPHDAHKGYRREVARSQSGRNEGQNVMAVASKEGQDRVGVARSPIAQQCAIDSAQNTPHRICVKKHVMKT